MAGLLDWYTQDDPRIAEMLRGYIQDRSNSENGLGNLAGQMGATEASMWGEGLMPLRPGDRYAKRAGGDGTGPMYLNSILDAQGNVRPGSEWSSQTDDRDFFKQALMMMSGPFAGPLAGAYGGGAAGAAGAGATIGGVAGHASTDSFQGGLRGAAAGALTGAAGYGAGQALGGAGNAAGYPGEGVSSGVPAWDNAPTSWPGGLPPLEPYALDPGQLGDPMQFDPNQGGVMNAGAPQAGAPSAMDEYLRSGATDMSTVGGEGGYAGSVGQDAGRELLGTFDQSAYGGDPYNPQQPPSDTVEINGQRLPPSGPGLGAGAAGAGALSQIPSGPSADAFPDVYEPRNTLDPSGPSPGGTPPTDWLRYAAPLLGAIGGAQGQPGGTTTENRQMDPRMQELLYGTGGLLGSARDLYNSNRSGVNDNMRAGWDRQLGLLNDPNLVSQLTEMRNRGGLLAGGSIAGNPFTQGGNQMTTVDGSGGLMMNPRKPPRQWGG